MVQVHIMFVIKHSDNLKVYVIIIMKYPTMFRYILLSIIIMLLLKLCWQ